MASLKIKYAAVIVSSLIAGGLISVTAWQTLYSSEKANSVAERKVLFWYDPMKPDVKFDKPGKSPFMDMDLVPKYADENDKTVTVSVSIRPRFRTGIKTQK